MRISMAGLFLSMVVMFMSNACAPDDRVSEGEGLSSVGQAESWTYRDDPEIFSGDLEYSFAALPVQGEASQIPWAGSYWPVYQDAINYRWDGVNSDSPAKKYEKAFALSGVEDAVSREHGIDSNSHRTACTSDSECNESLGENCAKRYGQSDGYCIPTWWGLCHGWAPGSILEPEPVNEVTYNGVSFKVNDLKALLSLLYTSSHNKFLSYRCNDNDEEGEISYDEYGRPDSGCRDTNPGTFHVLMANYLGLQGQSFVEDRTFDAEVWNQPLRAFDVTHREEISYQRANQLIGATSVGGQSQSEGGSVTAGEWMHFGPFSVSEGALFKASMTGSQDADLYLNFGARPTSSAYVCRPYSGSSNETCELTVPSGQSQVYVSVQGYAAQSDFDLTIIYGGSMPSSYVFSNEASRFFHIVTRLEYITESHSETDGNLSANVDYYTRYDSYEYVLELDHQGLIIGGEWIGDSKRDHPDFLWLPIAHGGASMAGGMITYEKVKMLLDLSVGSQDPISTGGTITVNESGNVQKGQWIHYGPFEAASGGLTALMTGTGDADLYLRKGAQATTADFDCRPYAGGSSEQCQMSGAGQYYVSVHGYASESSFTLEISYASENQDDGPGDPVTVTKSDQVAEGQWIDFGPYQVADGGSIDAQLTASSGDPDLYLRQNSWPTGSEFDCRSWNGGTESEACQLAGPGTFYLRVYGYHASDYQLTLTYHAAD